MTSSATQPANEPLRAHLLLSLPEKERTEALAAGATRFTKSPGSQPPFDLDVIGPEWVFGRWLKDEPAWCLAAHAFAGQA